MNRQQRAADGKFLPAQVKVGSLVVTMTNRFNPGFTSGKAYKVIKTCRSDDPVARIGKLSIHLGLPTECCVLDDDGIERYITLNKHGGYSTWEVVKCPTK